MKIEITGHTHGIGKAFAEQLAERGHSIVGISRRDGENIRRVPCREEGMTPYEMMLSESQERMLI